MLRNPYVEDYIDFSLAKTRTSFRQLKQRIKAIGNEITNMIQTHTETVYIKRIRCIRIKHLSANQEEYWIRYWIDNWFLTEDIETYFKNK